MLTDTIAAIATPLQAGAISIIKVSGDQALPIVNQIFTKDLSQQAANTIVYGHIKEENHFVDEVLVSVFKAPRSFTMEDVVEINCHGGVYVTQKILTLLLAHGARLAQPGEFTQRAFLNGRIDLTQAEATNDLILAQNEYSSLQAVQAIGGSVKKLLDPLLTSMINTIAALEVNIDYPEYDDVEVLTNQQVVPQVKDWVIQLDEIIKQAQQSQILKQGVKTVIIGKPNVGKSSLFNALLQEDKAIVTNIEGTTRDLVEGVVRLQNVTLHLIDTAGLRNTVDVVEQIGIEKTNQAIDSAELILFVVNGEKLSSEEETVLAMIQDKPHLLISNKADINPGPYLNISAINRKIEPLIQAIEQLYLDHQQIRDVTVLNNQRQIGHAIEAKLALNQALSGLEAGHEPDLVLIDIERAYTALKEILGEVSKDDLLDTLFKNFCLGK